MWGHDPRRDPGLLRGIPRSSLSIPLCSGLAAERASFYKARQAQMAGISSAGQSSMEVFVNINKQMQPGSEALSSLLHLRDEAFLCFIEQSLKGGWRLVWLFLSFVLL